MKENSEVLFIESTDQLQMLVDLFTHKYVCLSAMLEDFLLRLNSIISK